MFSWPPAQRKEAAWKSRSSGPRWETLSPGEDVFTEASSGAGDEQERRCELTFETVMWRSMRRQVAAVLPRRGASGAADGGSGGGGGGDGGTGDVELECGCLLHGGYLEVMAFPCESPPTNHHQPPNKKNNLPRYVSCGREREETG